MAKVAASTCLLSVLAMGLIGCSGSSSKQPEENPNIFPADYKNEVLFTMSKTLDDPTNIRGAFISEPVLRPAGKDERYTVCVRSDSRNANRHYTGSTDRIGYFYAGHLNQLVEATKEQCGNAAYKPFPELEKLCQAKKCA
ncbi:MAG TPA: hypothetical protein VFL53_15415 [Pseudolabrys sp.]|jgi:hypothetical protein|nr:hypothetical protein [Pseudolabrys sp.]